MLDSDQQRYVELKSVFLKKSCLWRYRAGDARPSKLFHVTIASVAPFDETRRILGPPDENAPGQRSVLGELDHSVRDFICGEKARRRAARLALVVR
jgi:hypothetical protein